MARSSWSGSITFGGFPIPVKAYNFTSTSKDQGFKKLCKCHGMPIKQADTCATDATILTDVEKGVEHGRGNFVTLAEPVIEQINGVGKSVTLEAEKVCPIASLPLHMSTGGYSIVAEDGKGAEKPVAILWRVLSNLDLALVTRWTPRAGSRDQLIAIHAGPNGLVANTLPMQHQLSSAPTGDCANVAVSDPEAAMFEQVVTSLYPRGDFDVADFPSQHNDRRTKAIEAAVAGAPMPAAATPAAAPVPDLMAALEASLAAAGATPVVPKPEAVAA